MMTKYDLVRRGDFSGHPYRGYYAHDLIGFTSLTKVSDVPVKKKPPK
jgi:hypothetical protein